MAVPKEGQYAPRTGIAKANAPPRSSSCPSLLIRTALKTGFRRITTYGGGFIAGQDQETRPRRARPRIHWISPTRPVIVTRRRRRQRRREQRERARSTRAGSQCDLCGSESTDRRLTGKSMSATLASGDQGASRRMRAGESAAAAGTAATCGDHGRPLWRQRTT